MHSEDIENKTRSMPKRAVVALSGGIDSSVAALLLKNDGYEVIGVTLQLHASNAASDKKTKQSCCGSGDIRDAAQVCHKLNIPHYVLNYEDYFKRDVFIPFKESYKLGQTPIPCIQCNEKLKFSSLLSAALKLGGDFLATGHYASCGKENDVWLLKTPLDKKRDQTYFLFSIKKDKLPFIRFPLEKMNKEYVRDIARKHGLTNVAEKKASQDLCFVNNHYSEFLVGPPNSEAQRRIYHINGQYMGEHKGISRYTVGQRHGLGLSGREPIYVLKINPKTNIIVVGPRESLLTKKILISGINWLGRKNADDFLNKELFIFAKIRSQQDFLRGKLTLKTPTDGIVAFAEPIYGTASGQACVFYEHSEAFSNVLGGGWITSCVFQDLEWEG